MKRFGELLYLYRTTKRLTQDELAEAIGVSITIISRIEHGREVDASTLRRILYWMLEEVPSWKAS